MIQRHFPWVLLVCVAAARGADLGNGAWEVHGQSTYVYQWDYSFPSPYSGPNSFQATPENDATFSVSACLGRRLWSGGALYLNAEAFQGYGLSHVLGVAAFPNGEAIKAGFPNFHYNTSRLYFQQVIGLGGPTEQIPDGPNQVAETVDVNRLVVTVGKFAGGDFFDGNAYSQDSRHQFMNWALLADGAWDEPGDVLGFTGGAVVQWNSARGTLAYGLMMEPTQANSAQLDHHLDEAYGQILEYDLRYTLGENRAGTLRPFVFLNRAWMGRFSAANAQAEPDIISTRAYRWKPGAGLSWDQALSPTLGVFARLSWNDGRVEDIAYSDIDRSVAFGASLAGAVWGRKSDTLGLALATDGLEGSHRDYLRRGGTGFLLGDGALNYGPEQIVELYYGAAAIGPLVLTPDWQYVEHPGYNRDRGGFSVYAVRAHVEF